jgi:hypothetical protein
VHRHAAPARMRVMVVVTVMFVVGVMCVMCVSVGHDA